MKGRELQDMREQVARELKYACEDKADLLRQVLDGIGPDHVRTLEMYHSIELRLWYLKELKSTLHALRFSVVQEK